MKSSKELLKEAAAGTLEGSTLSEIARRLDKREGGTDTYRLLLALGRGGSKKYESTVAGFLSDSREPELVKLSLQILCDYWKLTPKYLPQLRAFCRGIRWDKGGGLQLKALTTAGDYLLKNSDPELENYILQIFEKLPENELEEVTRNVAYQAMCIACGLEPEKILRIATSIEPTSYSDQIVADFRRRIQPTR